MLHDGVHHYVEDGGGERVALGDTAFGAEGAAMVSGGAADEDGLSQKVRMKRSALDPTPVSSRI